MAARPDFEQSIAAIIGINAYHHGVPPLKTAAGDARRLAQLLADEHDYNVHLLLDEQATLQNLRRLFEDELPRAVGPDDRVLFYFAGHGVALEGDDGPTGYLLPQDARRGEAESYLHMPLLYEALNALECRHMLVILDSCFSGAFRWSTTRDLVMLPEVIHQERYDRFILDPAWQAIASASHDQKALDELPGTFGERGDDGTHSPFASALFDALAGAGDVVPAGEGDGVITASELYLYLEDQLQPTAMAAGHRQTPRLWPLAKHDKGEFIFLTPGHELNLPPAPPLTYENNPWRGLESYDEEDADLFFGRDAVIEALEEHVESHPLAVVLGASGTGKSSVVKAGLVPKLKRDVSERWHVLPIVRPGLGPMQALDHAVAELGTEGDIETRIAAWCAAHPDQRLVLVVDQFEELVTLVRETSEREMVLGLLLRLVEAHPKQFRLILTLRSDFEPQFDRSALEARWKQARYVVPPMTQDEVRAVIERPASERVMYFSPHGLVDALINEVIQTPGGLPLLSFALSEMYVHYIDRRSDDRAIETQDYEAVGGVVGALRTRADAEFEALDEAHRETMRRLMLRMVAPEGGNVARRRVLRSELEYADPAETERAKEVVRRLTAARLVVEGRGEGTNSEDGEAYVEPAHDALVRAWDRLLGWIHAEHGQSANLRFQQSMAQTAREWERTEDKKAKAGLLWRDAARGGLLAKLVAEEEVALDPASLSARHRLRRQRIALQRRLLPGDRDDKGGVWMNRRELAFARRSIRRRRNIRLGLTALVLLIVASAIYAFDQAAEATTRALAAESITALQEGDRVGAFYLAREAWEQDDNDAVRAALRRLRQTVLPLATVTGDKVLVPDATPLIFTSEAIYDGAGALVDSVRANHLAFAESGAYFLAITRGPDPDRPIRTASYVLHDGLTADALHYFSPHDAQAQAEVYEADNNVVLEDASEREVARWPGCCALLSDDGSRILSISRVTYGPEFWVTWDLRDAQGNLLDTLQGFQLAPRGPYTKEEFESHLSDGDGVDPSQVDRIGSFRLDSTHTRVTLESQDGYPLLSFNVDETIEEHPLVTNWARLTDWQNNLISDFVFLRTRTYGGPTAPLLRDPEGLLPHSPGPYSNVVDHHWLDNQRFEQSREHQEIQFFPATQTVVLWDREWGGTLWSVDELRRARWLAGSFHKVSADGDYVLTRDGDDLIVWDWQGNRLASYQGRDVFLTPDLRRHALVQEDGTTVVRVADSAGVFTDAFVIEPPERFGSFDDDGRGIMTQTYVSTPRPMVTGGPRRWDYEETERLRGWQGEVMSEFLRFVTDSPEPTPPPRVEALGEMCLTEPALCTAINDKTIRVWEPDIEGGADLEFDLYERGNLVFLSPSGLHLLGVTLGGRVKLWELDLDFDPEAFLAHYGQRLQDPAPLSLSPEAGSLLEAQGFGASVYDPGLVKAAEWLVEQREPVQEENIALQLETLLSVSADASEWVPVDVLQGSDYLILGVCGDGCEVTLELTDASGAFIARGVGEEPEIRFRATSGEGYSLNVGIYECPTLACSIGVGVYESDL